MNCINYQTQPRQKFPEDISNSILHSPVQPKLHLYPWRYLGCTKSVKRRFQSSFFAEFSWLEYSVQQDAANCFCCRYWGKESSPLAAPTGFLTGSVQQVNKDNILELIDAISLPDDKFAARLRVLIA